MGGIDIDGDLQRCAAFERQRKIRFRNKKRSRASAGWVELYDCKGLVCCVPVRISGLRGWLLVCRSYTNASCRQRNLRGRPELMLSLFGMTAIPADMVIARLRAS